MCKDTHIEPEIFLSKLELSLEYLVFSMLK